MASSAAGTTGWYRGKVKAVPSGDCLVIMAMTANKPGPPPEKTITLSSLIAPRLVNNSYSINYLSLDDIYIYICYFLFFLFFSFLFFFFIQMVFLRQFC